MTDHDLTEAQLAELLERAARYVNTTGDDEELADALGEAVVLVNTHIGAAIVPDTVRTRAYLEAVSELYHRRNAPSGVAQFATPDGAAPMRVARDPLVGVYPLLRPYVGLGIA